MRDNTSSKTNTIMAMTVGGAPRPLALSIKTNAATRVLFFASEESAKSITATGKAPDKVGEKDTRGVLQILNEENYPQSRIAWGTIIVPEQDLNQSVEIMHANLLALCDELAEGENLLLDFTGGTKLMSAALALAGERLPTRFCYVAARRGGKSRDKGGLGITIDGEEKVLLQDNLRDTGVFSMVEDAMVLMRAGSHGAASRLLQESRSRITDPRRRNHLQAWIHFADIYDDWDKLRFLEAQKALEKCRRQWEAILQYISPAKRADFEKCFHENAARLESLSGDEAGRALYLDLVANADRRAAEGAYDEAVLRLYKAAECRADDLLREKGLEAANIDVDLIPGPIQREMSLYKPRGSRPMVLGHRQKWELLQHFEHEDADRFFDLKLYSENDGRTSALAARNGSILVHGYRRSSRRDWSQLRYRIVSLLRIQDEELVRFATP